MNRKISFVIVIILLVTVALTGFTFIRKNYKKRKTASEKNNNIISKEAVYQPNSKEERAILYLEDGAVLINQEGKHLSAIYANIQDIGMYQKYLRYTDENGKIGYLNSITGNVAVDAAYDEAKEAESIGKEIAIVKKDDKYCYIDLEDGGRVISEMYDKAYRFVEGQGFYARVVVNREHKIIDRDFKTVVDGFDNITEIHSIYFYATGQIGEDGYLINLNAEKTEGVSVEKITEGYTVMQYMPPYVFIQNSSGKMGVWTRAGILEPTYDKIEPFYAYNIESSTLVANCIQNEKYGVLVITDTGSVQEIIAPEYDEPLVFSSLGKAVAKKGSTYGFVDLISHSFEATSYQKIEPFYDDATIAIDEMGRPTFIEGDMSIHCPSYKEIGNIHKGFAIVIDADTGKYGVIRNTERIIECEYDYIRRLDYPEYYLMVKDGNKSLVLIDYDSDKRELKLVTILKDFADIDTEHMAHNSASVIYVDENGKEITRIYNLFEEKIYSWFDTSENGYTTRWIDVETLKSDI